MILLLEVLMGRNKITRLSKHIDVHLTTNHSHVWKLSEVLGNV